MLDPVQVPKREKAAEAQALPFQRPVIEPSISNVMQIFNLSKTEVKVQKIFYSIAAFITGSIGYLALVIGTAPSLLLAVPTLTIAGMLIWSITRMKDYADPEELAHYRAQAAMQPLEETFREHGWESMIQYGIPSQEAFNSLWKTAFIEKSSFADGKVFKAYEALQAIVSRLQKEGKPVALQLPSLSLYRQEFLNEIAHKPTVEVYQTYDMAQLAKHGLVSEQDMTYLSTYQKNIENLQKDKDEAKASFEKAKADLTKIQGELSRKNFESEGSRKWQTSEMERINAYLRGDEKMPLLRNQLSAEDDFAVGGLQRNINAFVENFVTAKGFYIGRVNGFNQVLKEINDATNKVKIL